MSLILSDRFVNINTKQNVKVELYKEVLKFYTTSNIPDLILNFSDVAGSRIGKASKKNDKTSYLIIYAYIKEKAKRKRFSYELAYSSSNTYEENFEIVTKWHKELDIILKEKFKRASGRDDIKPFLVFVNPKAGSGRAKNIFFERVCPIFAEANVLYVLIFTQKQNFAREYIKNINLEDYSGILALSGDGLAHEVINGLMDREDWKKAIKIPIGHIPGGSANALSCCVAHLTKEFYKNLSLESFAAQTSFNLTKSIPTPLDLVSYELCNKKIVHSFLSFEWAIIADVDLESEKYRYLGGLRFTLGALKRIINLRKYRGRLSFLPSDECKNYTPKDSSLKLNKNGSQVPISEVDVLTEEPNEFRTNFKYLPKLEEPVPNDWLTIEENFILLLVSYLPFISPDFMSAPESNFNDGNMYLAFVKEGITKAEILKLFVDTDNGNHLNHPLVECVKIKAFRLEPIGQINSDGQVDKSNRGLMAVDGEKVPTGIIQGEVMPSMANILANVKE